MPGVRKSLPNFKFDNQILKLRIALQEFRITSGRGGGLGVVASRMEARVRAAGVSPFRLVVNPWTQAAGTEKGSNPRRFEYIREYFPCELNMAPR